MLNNRTSRAITLLCLLYKKGNMTTTHLSALMFLGRKPIEEIKRGLKLKGVIMTTFGKNGSVQLSKPADQITLFDVVDAMNTWPDGDREWNYTMFGLKTSLKRVTLFDIIDGARTY